jgi:hypothetical protein
MDEANYEKEVGEFTGLSLDLPFGQHPFDWFLSTLNAILGKEKTAQFLGVYEKDDSM